MVHNKVSSLAVRRVAATLGEEPWKTVVFVLPNDPDI
jgi:hypothetical protein